MNTRDMQSNFQFCGSRILRFYLQNDFVSLPPEEALHLSPDKATDVKYEIVSIEKKDGHAVGILRLHITTVAADGESKGQLGADLWIEGCFVMVADLSPEDIRKFLIVNGSASLYSIARSFIASVTSQSLENGKLILPMISTYALYAAEDSTAMTDSFQAETP